MEVLVPPDASRLGHILSPRLDSGELVGCVGCVGSDQDVFSLCKDLQGLVAVLCLISVLIFIRNIPCPATKWRGRRNENFDFWF